MLCCIIEFLACHDQVNVPALLGCEVAMRRIQLLESAYDLAADKKNPDFFHAEDFMGLGERSSGAVVSAAAERQAADRLAAHALVATDIRKSTEALGKKGPNGPHNQVEGNREKA